MTNQQILEEAIQKASLTTPETFTGLTIDALEDIAELQRFARALWGEGSSGTEPSHYFPAKQEGFRPWKNDYGEYRDWSDVPDKLFKCVICGVDWGVSIRQQRACNNGSSDRPGWQHHLQQMVIAEDPIAYLGENL